MKGAPSIPLTVSDSPAYFKTQARPPPLRLLGLHRPVVQVEKSIFTPFSRVVDYLSYRLLNSRRMISLQEARSIHDTNERVVGLCPTLRKLHRRKADRATGLLSGSAGYARQFWCM